MTLQYMVYMHSVQSDLDNNSDDTLSTKFVWYCWYKCLKIEDIQNEAMQYKKQEGLHIIKEHGPINISGG